MSDCARCDLRPVGAARGLCPTCYKLVARKGILHRYPLLPGERGGWTGARTTPEEKLAVTSPVCVCSRPVRQRIPLFGAWQCGHCGRPFLTDLAEAEGYVLSKELQAEREDYDEPASADEWAEWGSW